jgi:hypothetical protein
MLFLPIKYSLCTGTATFSALEQEKINRNSVLSVALLYDERVPSGGND